jgi:hypothetical protein
VRLTRKVLASSMKLKAFEGKYFTWVFSRVTINFDAYSNRMCVQTEAYCTRSFQKCIETIPFGRLHHGIGGFNALPFTSVDAVPSDPPQRRRAMECGGWRCGVLLDSLRVDAHPTAHPRRDDGVGPAPPDGIERVPGLVGVAPCRDFDEEVSQARPVASLFSGTAVFVTD